MDKIFAELFTKEPIEIIDNDYYYDTDQEGDQFRVTDEELLSWVKNNWANKKQNSFIFDEIASKIASDGKPFMEIACGPGMGMAPVILMKNPSIPCLATDACSKIIKAWRNYINQNLPEYNISLASFSVLDMPIKDNSFDYVTSLLGIGSTRNGEAGKIKAINEVYRVLKPGGYFIANEIEFVDMAKVEEVHRVWDRKNWYRENRWHDKFISANFQIESEDKFQIRKFTKDDNDFGEAAHRLGIEIEIKTTLYVLRRS